jgi:hypothetical protein
MTEIVGRQPQEKTKGGEAKTMCRQPRKDDGQAVKGLMQEGERAEHERGKEGGKRRRGTEGLTLRDFLFLSLAVTMAHGTTPQKAPHHYLYSTGSN